MGLDFSWTQECVVDGCYFHDISGAGVQIGSFNDPLGAVLDTNNTVSNTIVNKAGAEFHGAAGINVGYTQGTVLTHNDVSNLTYGAISMGWGWSRHACASCTNAGWNTIAYNRAHNYKLVLNDGGGIYMVRAPGSPPPYPHCARGHCAVPRPLGAAATSLCLFFPADAQSSDDVIALKAWATKRNNHT